MQFRPAALLALFAFFVSLVFALIGKDDRREQLRLGGMMFAGFLVAALDEEDSPRIAELGTEKRLLPVVNMTLNLTDLLHTEWAERKAASFTATGTSTRPVVP